MVQLGNLKFSTNMGVMYALKQKYNHNTLKETYALLNSIQDGDIDVMMDIAQASYNRENGTNLDIDAFSKLLDDNQVGFMRLAELLGQIVEGIMFSGLSPEEVAERKNQLKNLKK